MSELELTNKMCGANVAAVAMPDWMDSPLVFDYEFAVEVFGF